MSGKKLINLIETPTYRDIYNPKYLIYCAFRNANKLEELRQKRNINDLLLIAKFAIGILC